MTRLTASIDQFLRCENLFLRLDLDEVGSREQLRAQLRMIAVCGALYGGVMGSFGGVLGEGWMRITASAVKVPFLFLVTFLLCLPPFYVINALAGLHRDFLRSLNAILGFQSLAAIVLAAFAPITWMMNISTDAYAFMVLWNGIIFGMATVSGFDMMRRLYKPLIQRQRRHASMLGIWVLLYMFVGIQMAWVLRPFVGSPDLPFQLYRPETWGNAYMRVIELIVRVLSQ